MYSWSLEEAAKFHREGKNEETIVSPDSNKNDINEIKHFYIHCIIILS